MQVKDLRNENFKHLDFKFKLCPTGNINYLPGYSNDSIEDKKRANLNAYLRSSKHTQHEADEVTKNISDIRNVSFSRNSRRNLVRRISALSLLHSDLYFLTFTIQDSTISDRDALTHLQNWIRNVRRHEPNFNFVWVAEVQLKRMILRNERVLHFHTLCSFPDLDVKAKASLYFTAHPSNQYLPVPTHILTKKGITRNYTVLDYLNDKWEYYVNQSTRNAVDFMKFDYSKSDPVAYLSKYFSKQDIKIGVRKWGASSEVVKLARDIASTKYELDLLNENLHISLFKCRDKKMKQDFTLFQTKLKRTVIYDFWKEIKDL